MADKWVQLQSEDGLDNLYPISKIGSVSESFFGNYNEITSDGITYTALNNGMLFLTARIGSVSTVGLYINGVQISMMFMADMTAATDRTACPIVTLVSGIFVKKGDVIRLARTFGNYAWAENARIIHY